jgi:hypothetical protein
MTQGGHDVVKIAVSGNIVSFAMEDRRIIFDDQVVFIDQTWIKGIPEMIVIVMASQGPFRITCSNKIEPPLPSSLLFDGRS